MKAQGNSVSIQSQFVKDIDPLFPADSVDCMMVTITNVDTTIFNSLECNVFELSNASFVNGVAGNKVLLQSNGSMIGDTIVLKVFNLNAFNDYQIQVRMRTERSALMPTIFSDYYGTN